MLHLGNFKNGQCDITDECKADSETGKIVSINQNNGENTDIFEKSSNFKLDDVKEFIRFDMIDYQGSCAYQNFIATYEENEAGDITIDLVGGEEIMGINAIAFIDIDIDINKDDYDEDNEEYFSVLTIKKENLLFTSAYLTVEEVLKERPDLKLVMTDRNIATLYPTFKNISTFYPNMQEHDKVNIRIELSKIFYERYKIINKVLAGNARNNNLRKNREVIYGSTIGQTICNIEDELQPLRTYIKEIQRSEAYKELGLNHFNQDEFNKIDINKH